MKCVDFHAMHFAAESFPRYWLQIYRHPAAHLIYEPIYLLHLSMLKPKWNWLLASKFLHENISSFESYFVAITLIIISFRPTIHLIKLDFMQVIVFQFPMKTNVWNCKYNDWNNLKCLSCCAICLVQLHGVSYYRVN